jgi:NAD+ kinase
MRIACTASDSPRAQAALRHLRERYDFVPLDGCDVVVALGGDGFLLHTMHEHVGLDRPIFGMNRGTVGFLMNAYRREDLLARIAAAEPLRVHPLQMTATTLDGATSRVVAFNEVAVTRHSGQSVHLRVCVDGVERLACFVGDGMIVATAAGSTAYNLSAHGPIIPLGAELLAVTPVCPFRPRRWRGALVPRTAHVSLQNLAPPDPSSRGDRRLHRDLRGGVRRRAGGHLDRRGVALRPGPLPGGADHRRAVPHLREGAVHPVTATGGGERA